MSERTGLLTYGLDRPLGGIGTYTRSLIHGLNQAGCPPIQLIAGRMHPEDNGFALPGSARVPGLLSLGQFQIARYVRQLHLDLVHDPSGLFPLYLAGCKKVVTLCDAFPCINPKTSTAFENLLYRLWLPLSLKKADAVITISERSQKDLIHYFPFVEDKITMIPLGKPPAFQPLPKEEVEPVLQKLKVPRPYILFVGSVAPRKNLLRLLKAYSLLSQQENKPYLVIVGSHHVWKNEPIAKTVAVLKLEDWVHFTGFVAEADLPALYNGAELFVFPSLYEGFGLPPLEAMACGTPVVTSNTSSLPEVVGDAALQVDPYDIGAIAAAIERVLNDPVLAEELRQRGLARAGQFSWQKMAEETIEVYKHVLNS
jgi:glycosyltransferase involved in cell wall biosynthesis